MRILIDTNVVLDLLARRDPFAQAAARLFQQIQQEKIEGYIAAHAIPTIDYILRRELPPQQRRKALIRLLSRIQVAAVDQQVIQEALVSDFKDFEDAVTHAAAVAVKAECVITRDPKCFVNSTIPILDPEVFLAQF